MSKFSSQLRVVIKTSNGDYGLAWQSNLTNNGELYYGMPKQRELEVLRGSYHKSGIEHYHLKWGKDHKRVGMRQSKPLSALTEPLRIVGSGVNPNFIVWGYKLKKDDKVRKTLVIDEAYINGKYQLTVYLWAIPKGQESMKDQVIMKHKEYGDLILGELFSKASPVWLYVVVCQPSQEMDDVLENSMKGK